MAQCGLDTRCARVTLFLDWVLHTIPQSYAVSWASTCVLSCPPHFWAGAHSTGLLVGAPEAGARNTQKRQRLDSVETHFSGGDPPTNNRHAPSAEHHRRHNNVPGYYSENIATKELAARFLNELATSCTLTYGRRHETSLTPAKIQDECCIAL